MSAWKWTRESGHLYLVDRTGKPIIGTSTSGGLIVDHRMRLLESAPEMLDMLRQIRNEISFMENGYDYDMTDLNNLIERAESTEFDGYSIKPSQS